MSDQSTQNPTPTVQVKEVGLPEQASVGKVLLISGVAAGAVAGLVALLTEKEEEVPASKTDEAKAYLRNALAEAQRKDLGKQTRKQRKRAEKAMKQQREKAGKDAEKLVKQGREVASESSAAVRQEVSKLLDAVRSGNIELDHLVENFAESKLMEKFREFGDEAKHLAEEGRAKGTEVAHKAQEELLPQAKETVEHARQAGKERLDVAQDRAKKEFIPAAQKLAEDVSEQAHELGEDAEKRLAEAAHKADEKRKEATKAVQKGGRESRSLLLWLSLAGILIFTVFLDEEQQQKLKEIAVEVFGEAKDMYSDMKGDTGA